MQPIYTSMADEVYLRLLLAAKYRRGSKMEKEEIIIDLFRKTAEADGEICRTDAYRRWQKSVRG